MMILIPFQFWHYSCENITVYYTSICLVVIYEGVLLSQNCILSF